jgi:hypothetical protein
MTKIHSRKARIAAATVGVAAVAASSVFGIANPASALGPVVVVSKLSVSTGSTAVTSNVLITGKNFTGVVYTDITGVTLAAATSLVVLNDTQIAVVLPTHAAGKVDIAVANASTGSAASANTAADDFTYVTPLTSMTIPTALKLNPQGGTVVPVTLTAGGFGTTAAAFAANKITATVAGVKATVAWVSNTVINVTTPAGTPSSTATAFVVSTNGAPTAVTAPVAGPFYSTIITKLSVTSGPVAGGTTVVITGKGLLGAGSFNFGYDASGAASISLLNAATCTIASDTSATCTTPVGPNDGSVVLASGNAASALRGAVSVIVVPAAGIGTTNYLALPGAAFTYTD